MKEKNFEEIINQTKKEVISFGYSDRAIKEYNRIFNNLLTYVKGKNIINYNYNVTISYFKEKFHIKEINLNNLTKYQLHYLRAFKIIDEIYNNKSIKYQYYYKNENITTDNYNTFFKEFETHIFKTNLSKSVIKMTLVISKRFLIHLENKKIYSLKEINYQDILSYIDSFPTNRKTRNSYSYNLRIFLNYLYEKEIILENYSLQIPNLKIVKQAHVPSIWNLDDIKLLLNSIDKTTTKGIRNYAIILLATTTSMRGIDIRNLKIQDIDFKNNKICFVQQKTKKYVELPLLSSTKEALKNYILEVRPKSNYNNVFLTLNKMSRPISCTATLTDMIEKYVEECKINNNQKRGIHSFRHTVLNYLFNDNETSLTTITEISGHSNPESLNSYIKSDIERLREFTLTRKDFGDRNV